MSLTFNASSVFTAERDEQGNEFFRGALDLTGLKKIKGSKVEVVLIHGDSLPSSLRSLVKAADKNQLFLVMSNTADSNSKKSGRRRTISSASSSLTS